jgi:hypothetical protein
MLWRPCSGWLGSMLGSTGCAPRESRQSRAHAAVPAYEPTLAGVSWMAITGRNGPNEATRLTGVTSPRRTPPAAASRPSSPPPAVPSRMPAQATRRARMRW